MTKTQNAVKSAEHLVSAVMRLMDKNIPVLVFWEHKGHLKNLGSTAMSKWFADLEDNVKKDLRTQMVTDLQSLINGTEELLDQNENLPDKVKASCVYKSVTNPAHPSGVPLLPFPLAVMNKKEKGKYLCDLIRSEARDKKLKFQYGDQGSRPSFWLEEDWSWSNLKESLFLVTEKTFTGRGTWMEFLSKTIKNLFDAKHLSPETHVESLELKSDKIMKKKKKYHGIHDGPSIVPTHEEADPECLNDDDYQFNSPESLTLEVGEDFNLIDPEAGGLVAEGGNPVAEGVSLVPEGESLLPEEVNIVPEGVNSEAEGVSLVPEGESLVPKGVSLVSEGVSIVSGRRSHGCPSPRVAQYTEMGKSSSGAEVGNVQQHSKISRKEFIPRRPIGKSPFKEASQQNLAKPCRIPIKMGQHDQGQSYPLATYLAVPDQVKHELVGYRQQQNTGGGSCLYKACASHISEFGLLSREVDYKELRRFTNEKLMEWWDSFSRFFSWPMQFTLGVGENSRTKSIQGPEEYFKFLKSQDSMDCYSESEVDLWVLCYVMNTTIGALTYNLPVGQGYGGCRFDWNYFEGQGIVAVGKFSCRPEPLYLLNEKLVHWSRLVPVEARDTFVEDLFCKEASSDGCEESHKKRIARKKKINQKKGEIIQKGLKRKNIKVGGPAMKKSRPSNINKEKTRKPSSPSTTSAPPHTSASMPSASKSSLKASQVAASRKAKLNRKKFNASAGDLMGQSENVFKEFHVSETIMEYDSVASGTVASKSDLYFVFPIKEVTLEELLRLPTPEESAEEERIDRLCISLKVRYKEIEERKAQHEKEMEEIDESIVGLKHRDKLRMMRMKENKCRRNMIESEFDISSLKKLCQSNLKYLERIIHREVYSERHEDFVSNGPKRDDLKYKSISSPFTDEQIDEVYKDLKCLMLGSCYKGSTEDEYLEKVLLPEALIKIYMELFGVEKSAAEIMIAETPLHTADLGSGDESE